MDSSPGDKVMSLADAVARFVHPGDVVHVAYSDARPNAALMQLVRRFAGTEAPRLSLTTAGLVSVQHALVELGIVDRVAASFVGENYPNARPSPAFARGLAAGRVELVNWSLWSLTARLMAGALGVPMFPVRSLAGSSMGTDLRARGDFEVIRDPFTGQDVGVVAALHPDVVVLHAVAADAEGNVVMSAPYGEAQWGAMAAKRGVIATVEGIAESAEIREHNALVKIPGHLVRAVCAVPFGSHPYGLYNPGFPGVDGYVEDHHFLGEVFAATRTEEGFRAWIDEWIVGTADHAAYLAKLGRDRTTGLVRQAAEGATLARARSAASSEPAVPAAADHPPTSWTPHEYQVVAASRRIAERVRAGGYQAVLAGVGMANLASWMAVTELKAAGAAVELMAEIGMFGYLPGPDEPFIFAHQNLPTCTVMSDVAGILGGLVGGPGTRSLGVLGAGQIDGAGNTNSTYDEHGRFIVGSGGANDIASGADELLLTTAHDSRRLAAELPYVTCPGRHVGSIVTSRAVFERDGEGFRLLRYLSAPGLDRDAAVAEIRASCGWDFTLAPDLAAEPEPTAAELAALRSYDPDGVFTRSRRSPASSEGAA